MNSFAKTFLFLVSLRSPYGNPNLRLFPSLLRVSAPLFRHCTPIRAMDSVVDATVPGGDTTKNPQIDGAYYLLLPELYPMMLMKLPIKSLIRCTSVCKQWRSIISSPSFISAHLSLSRQNPLLLTAPTTKPHNPNTFDLCFDTDPPLRLSQTFHCPFPTRGNGSFRVVGSVDGLVCLSDDLHGYTYTMILWNPSIRKSISLPMPRFNYEEIGPYSFMLGFGLDSARNDYKVVRLVYPQDEDLMDQDGRGCPLVEVFSLRERSWRTVINANMDYLVLERQCFFQGAVHWVGRNHSGLAIVSFDVGKEEFNTIALPQDETENMESHWGFFALSVIGGMLSVHVHHVPMEQLNIWVKRDYFADSWTKVLSLDSKELHLGVFLHLRRVCGGGDAGDRRDIQVPATVGFGFGKFYDGFAFSHTESLVLLDEDTTIEEVCEALEKKWLG